MFRILPFDINGFMKRIETMIFMDVLQIREEKLINCLRPDEYDTNSSTVISLIYGSDTDY
jgi:hypothetical protein